MIRGLAALPNVQIIRLAQGLMGTASAKPTNLLVVNMPKLLLTIHTNRVRMEIPKATSIGKDSQGRWKITALKEYAPALCSSLATEFGRALHATPVAPACEEPSPEELARYNAMVVKDYSTVIGADFARRQVPGAWQNSSKTMQGRSRELPSACCKKRDIDMYKCMYTYRFGFMDV